MKTKIIISTLVAFVIALLFSPPDPLTAYIYGITAAFLCSVALLILARYKFFRSSPDSMRSLVCILVCMVSILSGPHIWSFMNNYNFVRFPDLSSRSSTTTFYIGNLYIKPIIIRSGILSKETECIICSVNSPKITSTNMSACILSFPDGNSVEVKIKNNETAWIDEQYKVTFVGPVLNNGNLLLLKNHRNYGEFNISSPEELATLVHKIKAEHADSER